MNHLDWTDVIVCGALALPFLGTLVPDLFLARERRTRVGPSLHARYDHALARIHRLVITLEEIEHHALSRGRHLLYTDVIKLAREGLREE